jgi:multidrug transporter EmrE-like cation transporter
MRPAILLILLAGLNSTIGNLLLKQSRLVASPDAIWYTKFLSPYFAGAILFYVVNLGLFAKALDRIPVSVGYPILAASGFAMLAITSGIVFGERFGIWQAAGLALVIAGIACLAIEG